VLKTIRTEAVWHRSGLPLLLETLATGNGNEFQTKTAGSASAPSLDGESTSEWVAAECARQGVEAEPAYVALRDIEGALANAAPALLSLPCGGFAGLTGVRNGRARLIGVDFRTYTISLEDLRDVLCAPAEARFQLEVHAVLRDCGQRVADPERVRRAMVRKRAGSELVDLGWEIRQPAGSSFAGQMIQAGMRKHGLVFGGAYAAEYLLSLGAWWVLGMAALSGRFDASLLSAWVLLISSALVFRSWRASCSASLAVKAGGLLKQRLLAGATRLDSDSVRHEGAGAMLARVMDADALESLALGGGLAALLAPVELVCAGLLLLAGAGGAWHALLLVIWIAVLGARGRQYFRFRANWTDSRLGMTDDVVERMNGHRTRVVQESPDRFHTGEDELLSSYLERSARLDQSSVNLNTLVPRLWLMTAVAALVPAFMRSAPPEMVAISIAAVLMAHRSFRTLASGLCDIAGAMLAWRKIRPLFSAASERGEPGVAAASPRRKGETVLEVRDMMFRYANRAEPVLQGCNLTIRRGERVLLEGASGNGKSTLASLLTGLLVPTSGLLLFGGLDYRTMGDTRWRSRIAYAPQSYENHVFSGSLAFNLLMGRAWPPRCGDMAEAEAVCVELGLGDLLARMPVGLDQIVGESGWQLSEGERSRVFLARALLAGADVLVADECFAALDPESLSQAYSAVARRAPALVMVAHP
jgi:ATP-binding cassette, subfamily B, bacterial